MEGLRPLGVGELLDAAIRIYRGRAKTLLAAVAIPVIPVLLFTALVSWSAQPDLSVDPTTGQATFDGGDFAVFVAGLLVSLVATVVATSVATAACYRSISGAYVGDDPNWRESLRFGWSRVWAVLGVTVLGLLATLGGLLACLVGVLVALAFFSVAMPAMLVEGLGPVQGMRRSWRLVRGTAWRVLGIVVLSLVLAFAFQAVLSAPLALIFVLDLGTFLEQVLNVSTQTLSTVLVTPFTAALTMALYVDLRVRKEGFDLVLWSQRLGNAPTGDFPAQPGAPRLPGGWAPAPASTAHGGSAPPPPPPPPPPSGGDGDGPGGEDQRDPGGGAGGAGGPVPTGWAPPPDDAPR